MSALISFTMNNDKTVIIDATDIESINQWSDGFRSFGTKVVTKSGSTYILKDSVYDVENAVTEALKKVANAQTYAPYLTLRDQFAMAALPAIIEKYGKVPMSAKWAYEVADDMVAARTKKEGGEDEKGDTKKK